MTVVATFSMQSTCAVVFGDLLISGPEPTTGSTSIPTIGDVTNFYETGSGWTILGLRQKINLIGPNCAVAWAGSVIGARMAIAELKAIAVAGGLSASRINEFVARLGDDPETRDLSLVGWFSAGDQFMQFRHEAVEFDGRGLGNVHAAGSGVFAVRDLAQMLEPTPLAGLPTVGSTEMALACGLSIMGNLLRIEHDTGHTLLHWFGGSYEVALFLQDGVRKIGDLTILLWRARVVAGGIELGFPSFVIKQQYEKDILLIRSARFRTNESTGVPEALDEQSHAVLPVDKYVPGIELPHPDMVSLQSPINCHVVHVTKGEQRSVLTLVEQTGANRDPNVRFERSGASTKISVAGRLLERLAKTVRDGT